MYLHINKHTEARDYIPIDLDSLETIKRCFWADDDKGLYEQYVVDSKGNYVFASDGLGRKLTGKNEQLKTEVKKGNIKLVNIRS